MVTHGGHCRLPGVACRWALATYLAGGILAAELREAVHMYVLRQARGIDVKLP